MEAKQRSLVFMCVRIIEKEKSEVWPMVSPLGAQMAEGRDTQKWLVTAKDSSSEGHSIT